MPYKLTKIIPENLFSSLHQAHQAYPENHHHQAYPPPPPQHPVKPHYDGPPACSKNTTKSWCIDDGEYPGKKECKLISKTYFPCM